MAKQVILIRDIHPEDYPWLSRTYYTGEKLYIYTGATYGCIDSNSGMALTEAEGETPFFEVPFDAIGINFNDPT